MEHPPKLVLSLCYAHNAWIVGSAAKPDIEKPNDYDLLVPFCEWRKASFLIPNISIPNTFGGWKCSTPEGIKVDVWPGELSEFILYDKAQYFYHIKSGIRISKIK